MGTKVSDACPDCGCTEVEEGPEIVMHCSHEGLTCSECGRVAPGIDRV